jgi:hypothetical protein
LCSAGSPAISPSQSNGFKATSSKQRAKRARNPRSNKLQSVPHSSQLYRDEWDGRVPHAPVGEVSATPKPGCPRCLAIAHLGYLRPCRLVVRFFFAKCRSAAKRRLPHRRWSVIIRAAQVVPALRAHQLAMVPGKPMRTIRANLRVVIGPRLGRVGRPAPRTGM